MSIRMVDLLALRMTGVGRPAWYAAAKVAAKPSIDVGVGLPRVRGSAWPPVEFGGS
jgi:hypothetical protein